MAFPLIPDIIDCVLTSLPDFATLLSTILVSKSFYEVFQTHPGSTLLSVAATQIGPELFSCAIRLKHFNRDDYLASRLTYIQGFPSEREFSHTEAQTVTSYVTALAKNDSVVKELELLFSTTSKDRASGSRSLLNPLESLKFRRAFYRWWLFNDLLLPFYKPSARVAGGIDGGETEDDGDVGDDTENDTEDDTDDDSDNDDGNASDVYLAKSNDLRKGFLSEFSDDEVAEMWHVSNFMQFVSVRILRNLATPEFRMLDRLPLNHDPSVVAGVLRSLRSFEKPEVRLMEQSDWGYEPLDANWPGFSGYLQEKGYDITKVRTDIGGPIPGSGVILDNRVKDDEECKGCHLHSSSLKLWSSTNWHLLPCDITRGDIFDSLPGALGLNNYETWPLFAVPWSFAHFVDRHVSPGGGDWSEGKVLCKKCVLELMGRHVLNSLRELKAQHEPQLENCWYGYRCRTQRKDTHAVKLNHLCEPTRGD